MELKAVVSYFLEHLEPIAEFKFSLFNPVFWFLFLIIFFILLRFWKPKKAFTFCLLNALLLIGLSRLETAIMPYVQKESLIDVTFMRTLASILMFMILIYYINIKGED